MFCHCVGFRQGYKIIKLFKLPSTNEIKNIQLLFAKPNLQNWASLMRYDRQRWEIDRIGVLLIKMDENGENDWQKGYKIDK